MTDKPRLLLLKLGEKVKDCIETLPLRLKYDYNALVGQLRNDYGPHVQDRIWYAELMSRKKQSNETIVAYMQDVQRLARKLNVHVSQRDDYTVM